jgi:hypothetical protein
VARKKSRRLVIDASVARSATLDENPTSGACRIFLQEVLDICHRVVMTSEIDREWQYNALTIRNKADERRSRFLVDWLFAMGRKDGKILRRHVKPNQALRTKVNRMGLSQASRQAIVEDLHLVEAAAASDSVVISRDDAVHRLLRGITGNCPEIRKIVWCNPVTLGEDGLYWLRSGAPVVKVWQLGSKRQ